MVDFLWEVRMEVPFMALEGSSYPQGMSIVHIFRGLIHEREWILLIRSGVLAGGQGLPDVHDVPSEPRV